MVAPSWSDEEYTSRPHQTSNNYSLHYRVPDQYVPLLPSFRNTFSADYSEEDMYDDAADQDQDHLYDEEPTTTTGVHDEMKDDPAKGSSLTKSYGEHANWADYSEIEPLDDQDDEVEIVKESIRAPSVEVIIPPRAVSVMDSDDSDQASSYFSEGEVDESPTSSPHALNDDRTDNITHNTSTKVFDACANPDQEEPDADIPQSFPELEPNAHYASPDEAEDTRTHLDDQFVPASTLGPLHDTGSASLHKPLAQLHPTEAARAPSPSEVAMVKPTSDVIIQQPFLQQLPAYRELPTYPLDMPGRDLALASTDWGFYESAHPHFVVSENSYVRDTDSIPFEAQCVVNPEPLDTRYASASTLPARLSNTSPSGQVPEAKPTPKCSIAQLLDQSKNNDEHGKNVMSKSLKRKVDQISDSPEEKQSSKTHDLPILANDLESNPFVESPKTMYRATERNVNTTSPCFTEAPPKSAPVKVSEEIETPPRKKVKRGPNQNNDGGSLMKMAAATIAGIAIGTVGTIIGLASLPQDYFL